MGKLLDSLQRQLETNHKKDAEDCLKIYEKLAEINGGSVWESQWRPLTEVRFSGLLRERRLYKPSAIGYIFLKGIEN